MKISFLPVLFFCFLFQAEGLFAQVCPCINDPCPPGIQAAMHWDMDNFCKDDTSMLWATWAPEVVPDSFIWTLVEPLDGAHFVGPTDNDTVFVLGVGLYCLQVLDSTGCWMYCGGMFPGDLPLVTQVEVEIDSSYCNESTGAIELTIIDTNIPTDIEYIEWEDGSTQSTLSNLAPGVYTVTVTRTNVQGWECPFEYTFTIPSLDTLKLTAQVTHDFSCTAGNGTIDLHIHPPGIHYDYEWSTGAATQDLSNLSPGSYTVTVTGPDPCSGIATFIVEDDADPIDNVIADVFPAACDLPTGAATLTIIGGSPSFSYEWSNGETGNPAIALLPGEHTVTVTGWGDCSFELTIDVPNVDSLIALSYEVAGNTYCDQPDGWIDYTVSPEGDFYEFEWSNGDPDEDLHDIPGGTYTVTISAGSCALQDTVIVPENTVHQTVTHSVLPAICGNPSGSIDLMINGGESPFVYQWSNDSITQDLDSLLPGLYVVTVTGQNGCVAVDSIVVTNENSLFAVNHVIEPNRLCADSNGMVDLTITPAGNYTFQWSDGSAVEDATGLSAGTFVVTITHESGCKYIEPFMVPDSLPDPDTIMVTSITCNPQNAGVFMDLAVGTDGCDSLTITTASYQPLDIVSLQAFTCDPTGVGITTDHVLTSSGCDSITVTTVVFVAADTSYLFGTTCDPAAVGITTQMLTNEGGCDSLIISNITLLPSDSIFINSTTCDTNLAGVSVLHLINQYGCDSTIMEDIALLPSHQISRFGETCLSTEAGVFVETFQNQYGCDSIITTSITLLPMDTTHLFEQTCFPDETGELTSLYVNQAGCDSIVVRTTTLFPLPELDIDIISNFNNYPISCNGAADGSVIAVATGVEPFQYIWSTGASDSIATGLSAGNYSVALVDGNGCISNRQVVLEEPEPLRMTLTVSHPGCFVANEGSIIISKSGGVEPVRYSLDGVQFQSSPVFQQLPGGMYTVTALDANDCIVSEIVLINVPLQVSIEAGSDQTIFIGDSAIIDVMTDVPFDLLAAVEWTGIYDPACPRCHLQIVTPIITTAYTITVTTEDGCTDADSLTVFVESDVAFYVPNVFTPNGDQINDKLLISTGPFMSHIASFVIYDRWGNQVFSQRDVPANDPLYAWDGTFRGKEMSSGVFAYHAVVIVSGRAISKVGNITLIR